jgi:hypothetical protein
MMHPKKWLMIFVNLVGGFAVLGSYAWGILTHSDAGEILWGGVPQSIRPYYTVGMFLAAAGYFAFTYFILFRLNLDETRVAGRFRFDLFNALYAAILIPSAFWMPLTFMAVKQSSLALVWIVRMVLLVVAAASLSLFVSLLKVEPREPLWAHRLALVGCVGFCIQTALLDAVIWASFFRA